jgi:AcrR family transcriptional regulator
MAGRRSTRRKIQAEGTRRDILAAARRLFAERGYAATSMTAIAEEAGVVVQTIYASVGPKRALILALNDIIDDEGGVAELGARLASESDPRRLLGLYVRITRQISERCGDIVWTLLTTQAVEPDVAVVVEKGYRRHDGGARQVVQRLQRARALRPGLPAERAGDILAAMTWHEHYRLLTQRYGWTFDECEAWLAETLATLLLRPAD